MDKIAQNISNRLSLRKPQKDSLEIFAGLLDELELKKEPDLEAALDIVKNACPTCTDFERDFISICFALATGVGKTRLMGAFIAYLYLARGLKNFFVLAPNLTIYNKLVDDFSKPGYPKYVFKGIGAFAQQPPRVITGDNYQYEGAQLSLDGSEVSINVFNISKINAETRRGAEPRIKRLSEVLGESYFNYLSGLEDLVLLMDESHHYRADRGMQVINELSPVLGLELTATPQLERANKTIKFKNVVYEYSLARAIEDGFVKEPAVATRKDFDPSHLSPEDVDRIKIEDGIRIHEDTKVALDIYARDNRCEVVKPFVLVVAKDTSHAAQLKKLIQSPSPSFFKGRYADKVMEIHSNQRGGEKEENIEHLLTLEDPNNKIEIVIHVNMLKEGWDVTNLYTIIPLRTAASTTLREQTIGRGLRLPYGKLTHEKKVDTLTIVAHDKFQEIIDEANKPDSLIKQKNIIELDPMEIEQEKEVITTSSALQQDFQEREQKISTMKDSEEKQTAMSTLRVERDVAEILPLMNTKVKSLEELKGEEAQETLAVIYEQKLRSEEQQDMFIKDRIAEAKLAFGRIADQFIQQTIEIPRIILQQKEDVKSGFHDFDLDTSRLNYQPVSEEILVKRLREQLDGISYIRGKGRIIPDRLENIIVNELMEKPEINYDEQYTLLFKLAQQALDRFESYLKEDDAVNVVQYNKREIAGFIYAQMMEHFFCEEPEYDDVNVLPFVELKEHNYSKNKAEDVYPYTETIEPAIAIPGKIFVGFKKACRDKYKFDSKTEKDFSIIIDNDSGVIKWLRPAEGQFQIYWDHNSRRYTPDFVVETGDNIFMVETKMKKEMDSQDVREKTIAALKYCTLASRYAEQHKKKPWKYLLIPHEAVKTNIGFITLTRQYEVKE